MSTAPEACPICGKPKTVPFSPFCSKRCADIDLGRWLKGRYAIPGAPAEDTDKSKDDEDPPEIRGLRARYRPVWTGPGASSKKPVPPPYGAPR